MEKKTNYEKMIDGEYYIFKDDTELKILFKEGKQFQEEFNRTTYRHGIRRGQIIKQWFGRVGQNFNVNPPFYCDYGKNIICGENLYINYDCVMLDVCKITIGDNAYIGPRVCIYTALHPLSGEIRNTGLEYGAEVHIGNNVWIGGNAIILPGVTIGDNVVIGAGSIVNKNLESNAVYAGNPVRKIRDITEETYNKEKILMDHYYETITYKEEEEF